MNIDSGDVMSAAVIEELRSQVAKAFNRRLTVALYIRRLSVAVGSGSIIYWLFFNWFSGSVLPLIISVAVLGVAHLGLYFYNFALIRGFERPTISNAAGALALYSVSLVLLAIASVFHGFRIETAIATVSLMFLWSSGVSYVLYHYLIFKPFTYKKRQLTSIVQDDVDNGVGTLSSCFFLQYTNTTPESRKFRAAIKIQHRDPVVAEHEAAKCYALAHGWGTTEESRVLGERSLGITKNNRAERREFARSQRLGRR